MTLVMTISLYDVMGIKKAAVWKASGGGVFLGAGDGGGCGGCGDCGGCGGKGCNSGFGDSGG